MAIEDAWVLSEHVGAQLAAGHLDWDAALAAYDAVRPEHCRRVQTTARRLYGPPALTPDHEPPMFTPRPLEVPVSA
jgi:3-hydroxybenzoate 6-monooxygenase